MPTLLVCHQKLSSEAAMSPSARRSQRCLVIGGCLKPFPKFHEMGGIFFMGNVKGYPTQPPLASS